MERSRFEKAKKINEKLEEITLFKKYIEKLEKNEKKKAEGQKLISKISSIEKFKK